MATPAHEAVVYGLRVTGLPTELLLSADGHGYPSLTVHRGLISDVDVRVTADRAVVDAHDGRFLSLDRASGEAVFSGPLLSADDMVHPYFGPIATIANRWAGREAFHAGSFELQNEAWALRAGREGGKSSLLAALSAHGLSVLADDAFITDGTVAFTGPRCIDLREPVPGVVGSLRQVRSASRQRLVLPPAVAQLPVGGWLFLRWSDEIRLEPVAPAQLLRWLAAGRSWRHLHSDPAILLALAAKPAWLLHRPRSWAALDETVRVLTTTLKRPI